MTKHDRDLICLTLQVAGEKLCEIIENTQRGADPDLIISHLKCLNNLIVGTGTAMQEVYGSKPIQVTSAGGVS